MLTTVTTVVCQPKTKQNCVSAYTADNGNVTVRLCVLHIAQCCCSVQNV